MLSKCNRICTSVLCTSHVAIGSLFGQGDQRAKERCTVDGIAKSISTRIARWVFCDEIVKSAQNFSIYFNWNAKTIMAFGLVGTNIFLGSMVPVLQYAFREFISIAIRDSNESEEYYSSRYNLFVIIAFLGIAHATNALLSKKLRDDLAFAVRGELLKLWAQVKQNDNNNQIEDHSSDIAFTSKQCCDHLVNLANARLSTLSYFAGALRSLYLNSGFISISLLGLTLEVPYLVVICFISVYAFNIASSWANAIFKKNNNEETSVINLLNSSLASGNYKECEKLNEQIHAINKRSLAPQFGLSFLNMVNAQLSLLIGAIIQLSTGKDVMSIINTSQNFAYAAVQASWPRTQMEPLKKLETADGRILDFRTKMKSLICEENRDIVINV